MQNIFYLMQKEFRQLFREKANLIIIFAMPFIQLVILGFAITTDVKNLSYTYLDQDHSMMSRMLIRAVDRSQYFIGTGTITAPKQAIQRLDQGKVKAVIMIPEFFERDVIRQDQPEVQILLDGVDGNSSGIAMAYLGTIFRNVQAAMLPQLPGALENMNKRRFIEPRIRMLYNPNLESVANIVPGIIVILLTMITLFLTAINIVKEKEIGTLEQVMVTPIKQYQLILGKIIPFAIMGFVMFNVGILAAGLIFNLWMKGNVLVLYLLCLVFMLTTLGLGILISTLATTQQQAMFFSWFLTVFAILLSGFFVPIENMPDWIQWMTYIDPLRYFMFVIRGVYLKGSGFMDLQQEFYSLLLYGVMTISLAINRFHKRIN